MKRSSLGGGFPGSPVGIGLGTPRKGAGLSPSVNGNGSGGLFTPGASTSTSNIPSVPFISSSTSSPLSKSVQLPCQSQHRVNGHGCAQNRSPIASSASASLTGITTTFTNSNGNANAAAPTPPSHRTNAFLAPNAFFKPPAVTTSTHISPSFTGTGLGVNGVQKPTARVNKMGNGLVKNLKRKRSRVSDLEDERLEEDVMEVEVDRTTSSLKSKTKPSSQWESETSGAESFCV